jgi:hypothetical protein
VHYEDSYTVTDLARIARANARSVQHWAASGILKPERETNRRGTGTPRLFSADEAIIACIMQVLLQRQTPIGEMLRIATVIRGEVLVGIGQRRALLGRIIRGHVRAWFVDFPEQANPASMLVPEGASDTFVEVFRNMNGGAVAIVIDLTTALTGMQQEVELSEKRE